VTQPHEKRKHRRIALAHVMEARLVQGEVEASGRVIDLSNVGAFIATDLEAKKGDLLEVHLLTTWGDPVPLPSIVARRSDAVRGRAREVPAGLGIVFSAKSAPERSFIQQAVLKALEGEAQEGERTP
jgi:hypothetical protein